MTSEQNWCPTVVCGDFHSLQQVALTGENGLLIRKGFCLMGWRWGTFCCYWIWRVHCSLIESNVS